MKPLFLVTLPLASLGTVSAAAIGRQHELGDVKGARANNTAQLIFNSISSLLQHWPNTIYRNGHSFVPAIIPAGTLLHHGRDDYVPPPSPDYFAFDIDHSYLFCLGPPCLILTYAARRDLHLGYFDGTSASALDGPRDFQDILFREGFVPLEKYDAWSHAKAMCTWAEELELDGIVRMEQSFEVILCDIDSSLKLISKNELVYPESLIMAHTRTSSNTSDVGFSPQLHPRLRKRSLTFPEPTIPALPAPPGWKGKQPTRLDIAFEAIRAGMWHNRLPGESRVRLDYSGVVSAYDETYASLAEDRRGKTRAHHRLTAISNEDKERLKAEVEEVVQRTKEQGPSQINWPSMFQAVIDRYGERLEDLRYILRLSDIDPTNIVAAARQKVLVMLTPYMVLPQVKTSRSTKTSTEQIVLGLSEPDEDWISRIHQACASYATSGITQRDKLTKQERLLANSIDGVQSEICSTLTRIWSTAFDSEDKPVFAKSLINEWKSEVEGLMTWLDWHMWVKCDPPCGPGLACVLRTWPWEVVTGEEVLGPTCRNKMLDI